MAKPDVLEVLGTQASMARVDGRADCGDDIENARARIAELIAAAERSKRSARLMHDDRQQEVVCIPPDQWNALCAALAACRGMV
jgi:hypothetical protein